MCNKVDVIAPPCVAPPLSLLLVPMAYMTIWCKYSDRHLAKSAVQQFDTLALGLPAVIANTLVHDIIQLSWSIKIRHDSF